MAYIVYSELNFLQILLRNIYGFLIQSDWSELVFEHTNFQVMRNLHYFLAFFASFRIRLNILFSPLCKVVLSMVSQHNSWVLYINMATLLFPWTIISLAKSKMGSSITIDSWVLILYSAYLLVLLAAITLVLVLCFSLRGTNSLLRYSWKAGSILLVPTKVKNGSPGAISFSERMTSW